MRSASRGPAASGTAHTAPERRRPPSPLRTSGTAQSGGSAADSAAVPAGHPYRPRPAPPDRPQRRTDAPIFWGRGRHGCSVGVTTYRRSLWFSLSLFSFSRSKENTSSPPQSSHRRHQTLETRRLFVDTCAWNHAGRKKFTGDEDFSTPLTSTTYDVLSDTFCHFGRDMCLTCEPVVPLLWPRSFSVHRSGPTGPHGDADDMSAARSGLAPSGPPTARTP